MATSSGNPGDQRSDGDSLADGLPFKARRKDPNLPAPPTARALLVDADTELRADIAAVLTPRDIACEHAASLAEAREMLAERGSRYDVVAASAALPDGAALDLLALASDQSKPAPCPPLIVLAPGATFDDAVHALRSGAADLVSTPCPADELAERVLAAARRSARERDLAREVDRLRRACKRLSASRKQIARQVDTLCNDLADAYQELADHAQHTAAHADFAAALRQELDVESILRACLEHVLKHTGPTNAAIFLPSSSDDFSLGAYVNCDIPKDSADALLDHLADSLAPAFQDEERIIRYPDASALRRRIGDHADWIGDAGAIVFACRSEGECLAVGVLFRDRGRPFTDDHALTMQTISDIFGAQLARVIKIHHRHKPDKAFRPYDTGEDDLAA